MIFLLAGAVASQAFAPVSSLRPKPREVTVRVATRTPPVLVYYRSKIRPKPRDLTKAFATGSSALAVERELVRQAEDTVASTVPVYRSPRPVWRPLGLARAQIRREDIPKTKKRLRVASTAVRTPTQFGAICGDRRLKGERVASISGKLAGCGVENPVRITSVDGVTLSQQSVMDCATAKTLSSWVSKHLKPTLRRRGGGVKTIQVAAHYSCRTRNSKPGAKISEHGKGHAIDIAAFHLKDGSKITVLEGWNNRRDKRVLEKLHASACGPFGTVLGPRADRHHKDHFHFDTARYRSGAYCR